jgi:hypothetical protein
MIVSFSGEVKVAKALFAWASLRDAQQSEMSAKTCSAGYLNKAGAIFVSFSIARQTLLVCWSLGA